MPSSVTCSLNPSPRVCPPERIRLTYCLDAAASVCMNTDVLWLYEERKKPTLFSTAQRDFSLQSIWAMM